MIDKQYGLYVLICDLCGNEEQQVFKAPQDAASHMKEKGWKIRKSGDEWEDVCPECVGAGE